MRRISYTMDGFCLLYLLLILLMRSGDVETNPGPNTAVSTVSEVEFLKLALDIDPSYYYNVGISLGFSHAELQANLIENLKNFKNALMDVFMKWNVKQQPPHSNKRQLLADKLREIDLGGLSDVLLNGPPIPDGIERPSRLLESQTKPPSAESQTKPLSPELIERCANDFKFKYRSTLCKIRADPLDPASTVQLKDMYTNLVLQEEHGTEKQILDYNDIFDLKVNGEFPKRIIVQGEAGAGKSTFCAKIAWDWIERRHFSHFVWVLIVPLHEFKQHTIGKIAKSFLAKNNPATVSQITEYIRSNPDKVFIAFDGLDKVSGKIMKTESCESQPTDQMQLQPSQPSVTSSESCGSSAETGDIGLVDILCSYQLVSCPVLVTTRPWKAVEIRSDGYLMKLYTFIHVEGFNRENLSVYIRKYFPKNDDKANQLIQFTIDNDVISENIAHYPIFVAMLCLMWKELDEQKLKEMNSLKTFSQIFKVKIAFLKEYHAQKEGKKVGSPSFLAYLKKYDELLEPIAKHALNGLLENTLVCGEDDFEICPESKDTAFRVGILSQEGKITTNRNSHVQFPVFFPHKSFQEYMAGVHLASLCESDRNEFNRLIEQVVLPRKEEFRYLLYFTVSQNKSVATHVMKSMLQDKSMNRGVTVKQIDFIVDVAFESQDQDVAALVKDGVSSKAITLTISRDMTAHTVAGYAFIGPHVVKLHIERDCGPTMSLDVAEMICSMPSLKEVSLLSAFYHCFYETLAKKGKESKVQTLKLHVKCPTPASSNHLVEALCSMPNLTDLTLGMVLNEEFYSTFRAMASSIQVKTLKLLIDQCPTPASSHHLVEALCSMPNLFDLTLGRILNEEFYSTLKEKASSIQVQTLKLHVVQSPTPASSHHLVEALCSMPNLTDMTLGLDLNEEFYSALKAKASTIQVQTLKLHVVQCPTPASSHHLVEALCSMPNLTDLTLGIDLTEEFYSTLKAKASSIQGCFPQIRKGTFRFNGVAQDDLNSFLHALTCLQRSPSQPLRGSYHGNTFITRNVSSEQTRAMYQEFMARTSRVNLVRANISGTPDTLPRGFGADIPVLQESQDNALVRQPLQQPGTLRNQSGIWPVSSENNALPWNTGPGQPQFMPSNLHSGMFAGYHTPAPNQPFSGYYNPTYHANMSSSATSLNPLVSRHDQPTMLAGYFSPTQYQPPVHESTVATRNTMPWSNQDHYTQSYHASTPSSALLKRHFSDAPFQPMIVERSGSSQPRPSQDHSTTGFHSASHYPPIVCERTSRPGSSIEVSHSTNCSSPIQSTSSTSINHPEQQPKGDVCFSRRTLPPSYHPQQKSMGDVHYPRRALPPSHYPQQQPMGDVHYPRRTLPSSDHPQQRPVGDVHYPRRALPLADNPQQHVWNTSETVCQLSQTHRKGSNSRSNPYYRQAPSTQSRVPQDDPEISQKQSKYEV